jgi:cell wall-associated NlpC family hydrolase
LIAALTQVGVPYKRLAMKPGIGFDCSGLTSFAWSQAGFNIPHNSTRQIRAADPRTFDTAQAGDLLRYPGHVMMWLGVGQAVIHSPQPRQFVEVKILNTRSMKRSTFGDPSE